MVTWMKEGMEDIGLYAHYECAKVAGRRHWIETGATLISKVWARDRAKWLASEGKADSMWAVIEEDVIEQGKWEELGFVGGIVIPEGLVHTIDSGAMVGKRALEKAEVQLNKKVVVMMWGDNGELARMAMEVKAYVGVMAMWNAEGVGAGESMSHSMQLLPKPRVVDLVGVWSVSVGNAKAWGLDHATETIGSKIGREEMILGIVPSKVKEQMRVRGIGGAIFKWWAVRWMRIRWSLTYEYWRVTREVVVAIEMK